MRPVIVLALLFATTVATAFVALAQQHTASSLAASTASSAAADSSKRGLAVHQEASVRAEGEKRFRQNCGRCHMAPQKFPPRMMATIVRHMRVRATITDEDARLILQYMTQ